MLGKIRSRSRSEDGQALVELALAIPFLLFVIFVIIDFGLAINTKDAAGNVANITVREAAVAGSSTVKCGSTTETTIQDYARCEATSTSSPQPCKVTAVDTTTSGSYASGDAVTVSISVPFNFLSIISGGVNSTLKVGSLSGTVTITQTATMRIEQTGSTSFLKSTDSAATC